MLENKEDNIMKFLLWEIRMEPYRLAKIQWMLFKIFGYRPKKNPCGHTKSTNGYYCHQPLNMKYCDIINDRDIHKVVCKCCGHLHIESNSYINPYNDEEWIEF